MSQPTEVGTVYTLEELEALGQLCHKENLLFHMDGSRLYNAAASLKCSLHTIVHAAQLDLLSLGGTKNGLMYAEALLLFNDVLNSGSDHLQKQSLQLVSKMRYLSSQYTPLLRNELWCTLADHANQKAKEIGSLFKNSHSFL
jgi:threonine aldolase